MRPHVLAACLVCAALGAMGAAADELSLVETGQGLGGVVARFGLAVSGDAAHVYASSDDFLVALRRRPDGHLTEIVSTSIGPADVLAEPAAVLVSPDGAHVYLLGSGGTIGVFARDPASGFLSPQGTLDQADGLGVTGADLAASPDGAFLYALGSSLVDIPPGGPALRPVLVTYAREPADGSLTRVQQLVGGDGGVAGLAGASHLLASPDGAHVYVGGTETSGMASVGTIAVFARGGDGTLTFVPPLAQGGAAGVTGFTDTAGLALAPDGGELVAASAGTQRLVRFGRDAGSGALSFLESVSNAETGGPVFFPLWLAFRPDGRRLYLGSLAGSTPGAATIAYAREAPDQALQYAGEAPGTGFAGAVSPDGRFVYTTGGTPVIVFAPEPGPGLAGAAALLALAARDLSPRRRRSAPGRARASGPGRRKR